MGRESCPDRAVLEKLLLGMMDSDQGNLLARHLLECPICSRTGEDGKLSTVAPTVTPRDDLDLGLDPQAQTLVVERAQTLLATLSEPTQDSAHEREFDFLLPGKGDELGRLAGYRVLRLLGIGGMGMVFEAEDRNIRRRVALKVMRPDLASEQADARARFLREARAIAAIEHDHIIKIHKVGEDAGVPFIAMPYLKGETLHARLKREGKLEDAEALRIARGIASGLAAAHESGLVHRDIKPDNIWLEAGSGRVVILDFGLVHDRRDATLTLDGTVMGTPQYMAPEQAKGEKADHRTDLFSLGAILYHLVSGKIAFRGDTLLNIFASVAKCDLNPIEESRPDLPTPFAALIRSLLAKEKDDRPQSAAEVGEAIAALESGEAPAEAEKPSPGLIRSHLPAVLIVTHLLAIGVGVFFAALLWKPAAESDSAQAEEALQAERRIGEPPEPAIAPYDADQARKHQEAWSEHVELPRWAVIDLGEGVSLDMILIPPGEFDMGISTDDAAALLESFPEKYHSVILSGLAAQQPLHRVRITRPYFLSRCEITVGQFRRFVSETNYQTYAEKTGGGFGYNLQEDGSYAWGKNPRLTWKSPAYGQPSEQDPLMLITDDDALAFCAWLSTKNGILTFTLPTEAQWEHACRAGTETLRYFEGGESALPKHSWGVPTKWREYQLPQPVGRLAANPFGLKDLYGNVAELCSDWYHEDTYKNSPTNDPQGPSSPTPNRVVRGGGYTVGNERHTSFWRARTSTSFASVRFGIRVLGVIEQ